MKDTTAVFSSERKEVYVLEMMERRGCFTTSATLAVVAQRYSCRTLTLLYTGGYRRTGMIASTNIAVTQISLPNSLHIRAIKEDDSEQVGTLLQRAYASGPDDQHPDLAGWRVEVRAIQNGQFGPLIAGSCFVAEHTLDHFHLA